MIGAAIGGPGKGLFGCFVVKSAQKVLGLATESWEDEDVKT